MFSHRSRFGRSGAGKPLLAALLFGVLPVVSASAGDVVPHALIVRFKQAPPSAAELSRWTGEAVTIERTLSGGELLLTLPSADPGPAISRLRTHAEVLYAQPNYRLTPALLPNDPLYVYQRWSYEEIDLPPAWDITTGSSEVVVAVIDSGITQHIDLAGKLLSGYDFVSNVAAAADGNGRDADPTDPSPASKFHGTHIAGIIGGASNNGIGITGGCFGCMIQPVRALDALGGTTADTIDAIRWSAGLTVSGAPANSTPASIINLSMAGDLGRGKTCSADDPAMAAAVQDAINAGVVVIGAAGNGSTNAKSFSPSSCPGVISVAAIDDTGVMAKYSNYGTVTVTAPGGGEVQVTSTYGTSDYMAYSGTSQAAAHVSATVGLMLSVSPTLTPAEVTAALTETAAPLGVKVCPKGCGAGLINAADALGSLSGDTGTRP